ncbi:hypothetical protein [Beggiatoa leptomitoformis]|uniref:Uncharacterized protein n=1 Tax=Beggiatoa leptomitoformis TaxID=288004 RepID=A0A650GRR1_9GAMM|nr:hypothetical protein [Beggiatoa leptomitoformis]QGX03867.1 hypothetical protein AL038_19635 [Beggiatoa leptomitoformis]QGX04147.1 hypothetical protein BLE401_18810 [Beggiatoa leptomitoformis]
MGIMGDCRQFGVGWNSVAYSTLLDVFLVPKRRLGIPAHQTLLEDSESLKYL